MNAAAKPAPKPGHEPTVRVVVANTFVGNHQPDAVARWLKGLAVDIAILNEVNDPVAHALRAAGFHLTLCRQNRMKQHECVIAIPGKLPAGAKEEAVALSPFVSHPWAPDRSAAVLIGAGGSVISAHANAVIQTRDGGWTGNEGAKVWRDKGLPAYGRLITRLLEAGGVVAGGDMNAATGKRRKDADPDRFFTHFGLKTVSAGLMFFAYDPRHYRVVSHHQIPKAPGADAHHGLVVEVAGVSRSARMVLPMTENTPEPTSEVAVEMPAKTETTVEVDATPETAGPAQPDAATDAMAVESKENPAS